MPYRYDYGAQPYIPPDVWRALNRPMSSYAGYGLPNLTKPAPEEPSFFSKALDVGSTAVNYALAPFGWAKHYGVDPLLRKGIETFAAPEDQINPDEGIEEYYNRRWFDSPQDERPTTFGEPNVLNAVRSGFQSLSPAAQEPIRRATAFGVGMATDPFLYAMSLPGMMRAKAAEEAGRAGRVLAASGPDVAQGAKYAKALGPAGPGQFTMGERGIAEYAPDVASWADKTRARIAAVTEASPLRDKIEAGLHRAFQAQMGLAAASGVKEGYEGVATGLQTGDWSQATGGATDAVLAAAGVALPEYLKHRQRGALGRAYAAGRDVRKRSMPTNAEGGYEPPPTSSIPDLRLRRLASDTAAGFGQHWAHEDIPAGITPETFAESLPPELQPHAAEILQEANLNRASIKDGKGFLERLRSTFGDRGTLGLSMEGKRGTDDAPSYFLIQRARDQNGAIKVVGGAQVDANALTYIAGGRALNSPVSAGELYAQLDALGVQRAGPTSPLGDRARTRTGGEPLEQGEALGGQAGEGALADTLKRHDAARPMLSEPVMPEDRNHPYYQAMEQWKAEGQSIAQGMSDAELASALGFENRERLLAGEPLEPRHGNHAPDFAAQELIRRQTQPTFGFEGEERHPIEDLISSERSAQVGPGRKEIVTGIYSKLRETIDNPKTQNVLRGQEWLNVLKSNNPKIGTPVKQQEMADTGLDLFLQQRANQRVTREEIQAHLDAQPPLVTADVRGAGAVESPVLVEYRARVAASEQKVAELTQKWQAAEQAIQAPWKALVDVARGAGFDFNDPTRSIEERSAALHAQFPEASEAYGRAEQEYARTQNELAEYRRQHDQLVGNPPNVPRPKQAEYGVYSLGGGEGQYSVHLLKTPTVAHGVEEKQAAWDAAHAEQFGDRATRVKALQEAYQGGTPDAYGNMPYMGGAQRRAKALEHPEVKFEWEKRQQEKKAAIDQMNAYLRELYEARKDELVGRGWPADFDQIPRNEAGRVGWHEYETELRNHASPEQRQRWEDLNNKIYEASDRADRSPVDIAHDLLQGVEGDLAGEVHRALGPRPEKPAPYSARHHQDSKDLNVWTRDNVYWRPLNAGPSVRFRDPTTGAPVTEVYDAYKRYPPDAQRGERVLMLYEMQTDRYNSYLENKAKITNYQELLAMSPEERAVYLASNRAKIKGLRPGYDEGYYRDQITVLESENATLAAQMPFLGEHNPLAAKYTLGRAVEQGYDRVAWVTGQQQLHIWPGAGFSHPASKIAVNRLPPKVEMVGAKGKEVERVTPMVRVRGWSAENPDGPPVHDTDIKERDLYLHTGKKEAQVLLDRLDKIKEGEEPAAPDQAAYDAKQAELSERITAKQTERDAEQTEWNARIRKAQAEAETRYEQEKRGFTPEEMTEYRRLDQLREDRMLTEEGTARLAELESKTRPEGKKKRRPKSTSEVRVSNSDYNDLPGGGPLLPAYEDIGDGWAIVPDSSRNWRNTGKPVTVSRKNFNVIHKRTGLAASGNFDFQGAVDLINRIRAEHANVDFNVGEFGSGITLRDQLGSEKWALLRNTIREERSRYEERKSGSDTESERMERYVNRDPNYTSLISQRYEAQRLADNAIYEMNQEAEVNRRDFQTAQREHAAARDLAGAAILHAREAQDVGLPGKFEIGGKGRREAYDVHLVGEFTKLVKQHGGVYEKVSLPGSKKQNVIEVRDGKYEGPELTLGELRHIYQSGAATSRRSLEWVGEMINRMKSSDRMTFREAFDRAGGEDIKQQLAAQIGGKYTPGTEDVVHSVSTPPSVRKKMEGGFALQIGKGNGEGGSATSRRLSREEWRQFVVDRFPNSSYIKEDPNGDFVIDLPGGKTIIFRTEVDHMAISAEEMFAGHGRTDLPAVGVTFKPVPYGAIIHLLRGTPEQMAIASHEYWHVVRHLGNLSHADIVALERAFPEREGKKSEEWQADAFAEWLQRNRPKTGLSGVFSKVWNAIKGFGQMIFGKKKLTEEQLDRRDAERVFARATESLGPSKEVKLPRSTYDRPSRTAGRSARRGGLGSRPIADAVGRGAGRPFEPSTRAQVSPEQARGIRMETRIERTPELEEAVAGTSGAELTEDGLLLDTVRFQSPKRAGGESIRSGVFYVPSTTVEPGTRNDYSRGVGFGGSDRHEGPTLLRAPLVVNGAVGGGVSFNAYQKLKGQYAAEKFLAAISNLTSSIASGRSGPDALARTQALLKKYGGDPEVAKALAGNFKSPQQFASGVMENVLAHEARRAGYDSIVGYSRATDGQLKLNEVFDLRESHYPKQGEPGKLRPEFQPKVMAGTQNPSAPGQPGQPSAAPTGMQGPPAPGLATGRATGNPPRVEERVSAIDDAISEQRRLGVPTSVPHLDRDTSETWSALDPEIHKILRTWDGSLLDVMQSKERNLTAAESQAVDAVIRGKKDLKDNALIDYQATRGTPGEVEAFDRYAKSLSDFLVWDRAYVGDGTGLARALAARARIMRGQVAPDRKLLRQIMKEFPNISDSHADQLVHLWESGDPNFANALRAHIAGNGKKFWTLYRAQLLSIPSEVANITGNGLAGMVEQGDRVSASAADWALSKLFRTGKRERYAGEVSAEIGAMMFKAPNILADYARERLWNIYKRAYTGEAKSIQPGTPLEQQISPFKSKFFRLLASPLDALGAADDAFQKMNSAGIYAGRAYRKAVERTGKKHGPQVNAEAARIIRDMIDFPEKYPEDINAIQSEAGRRVFRDKAPKIAVTVDQMVRRHPWMTMIAPFIKTPANITRYALRHSPTGIIGAILSKDHELRKAYRDFKSNKISQGQFADTIAPRITGMMLTTLFAGMAQSGMLTGAGPTDPNQRRALQASGWQPYSMVWTGSDGKKVYVPYSRFAPVSQIVGTIADIHELKDAKNADDVIFHAYGSIIENIENQSFLRGVVDFGNTLSDPKQYLGTWASNVFQALTPGTMDKLAYAIDPQFRQTKSDTKGLLGAGERLGRTIVSQTPFASRLLPGRTTPTGEPMMRPGGEGVGGGLARFLLPTIPTTEREGTEVESLMGRVGGVSETKPYLTIEGTKVALSSEQKQVMIAADQKAASELRRLLASPRFAALPDTIEEGGNDSKEHVIRTVYNRHRSEARQRLLRSASFRTQARQQIHDARLKQTGVTS